MNRYTIPTNDCSTNIPRAQTSSASSLQTNNDVFVNFFLQTTTSNSNFDDIALILEKPASPRTTDERRFMASRTLEFSARVGCGAFKVVDKLEAHGRAEFCSHFVDIVKNERQTSPFQKSRLFVPAYNDKGHWMLTYAPTVQRSYFCFFLCHG